LSDVHVYS
jgi:hypothetical protein